MTVKRFVSNLCRASVVVALFAFAPDASRAGVASSKLLPATTKAHISVANWTELVAHWNGTQLARIFDDKGFKPFLEEMRQQGIDGLGLGIAWDDLRAVAAGEVSWATVQPKAGQAVQLLLVDAAGKGNQAKALLAKVAKGLHKRGFQSEATILAGVTVQVHSLPAKNHTDKGRLVVSTFKDNVLILGDSKPVVQGLLERFGKDAPDSLSRLPAYQRVQKRAKARTTGTPDVFWFIEPIGYLEALRASGKMPRPRGPDAIATLKQEGFGAVRGLGGFVLLGGKDYELAHFTAIYAPGPFKNSMRMLGGLTRPAQQSGQEFTPPPWVPAQLSTHATIYYDVKNSFDAFGSYFDAFYADGDQGTFNDIIKQLRDDPNGPGIDLPKEVLDRLGQRLTLLTDAELPLGPDSDRMVLAIEAKDAPGLERAVRRMMENDPEVKRRDYHAPGAHAPGSPGITLWQIPQIKKKPAKQKTGKPAAPAVKPPDHAVTVAHGQLFVANNVKLLEKVLATKGAPLPRQVDFDRVAGALKKWVNSPTCLVYFSRLDENLRIPYDALRRDQLAGIQSINAQLLYMLLGGAKAKIQGKKLPAFDRVSPYLGPSGVVAATDADGWLVSGLILKKQP